MRVWRICCRCWIEGRGGGETESSEVWVKAQEALRRWARLIYWLQIIFHPHPNDPHSYHHCRHNRPQFLIGGGVMPLNIIGDQRPNLIHSTPPSLVVVLKGNMNKRSGSRPRSFTFSWNLPAGHIFWGQGGVGWGRRGLLVLVNSWILKGPCLCDTYLLCLLSIYQM